MTPIARPNSVDTYVAARAAQIDGDQLRSAQLFAAMASADPTDIDSARRAIGTAIQIGDMALALKVARTVPIKELGFDARLLLEMDEFRRNRPAEGLKLLDSGKTTLESELLAPLARAWMDTAAGRVDGAQRLAALPASSPLASVAFEQRLYMLATLGKAADIAEAIKAAATSGEKPTVRTRLSVADSLLMKGQTQQAATILDGPELALWRARDRVAKGAPLGQAVDTTAKGLARLLVVMAADLGRGENRGLAIAMTQIARHLSPDDSGAAILLGVLLDRNDQAADALAVLTSVKPTDLFANDATDLRSRVYVREKRLDEALKLAETEARAPDADRDDFERLGDVLGELHRYADAADAYARAIDDATRREQGDNIWTLRLLRADSLEKANRWTESRAELEKALKVEPDNPVLLNFMGYGKLERGEDLDTAEAMIRKASDMRPDDASITDSLGWALYKRGNLGEAVDTLLRAAKGDPAQSEIHEHLGDALFKSGRRIEARFAWQAALVTADDAAQRRLEAKLGDGLTDANAAP